MRDDGAPPPHADTQEEEEPRRRPASRYHSYLHGGTSSLLSALPTVAVFPLYKTVFRQQLHSCSVRQAVAQLRREGPLKLYRGVTPPLLMRTLNGTLLFGLQDTLLRQLSSASSSFLPPAALPAVAGLAAGLAEALVFTPFERVQNVLQNGRSYRRLPTLRSVAALLGTETLAAGYYRGLLPIAARNGLGSCLYFGLKGPLCALVEGQWGPLPLGLLGPTASSFLAGTLTSVAVSLPLYPLSVLVVNMQAGTRGDAGDGGAGTVRYCWRRLWESRGRSVALLYRGGSLVVLRSCITWGITTAIYDQQQRRAS
ncbi:unnamed protein product [Merluccius merluccius]